MILEKRVEDGKEIEPKYFYPIFPLHLINGCEGIATGWNTFIPCFNPVDVANYLIAKLDDAPRPKLIPWYRGFTGTIEPAEGGHFTCRAPYSVSGDTVTVTDLPIGTWTDKFTEHLNALANPEKAKAAKAAKKRKAAGGDAAVAVPITKKRKAAKAPAGEKPTKKSKKGGATAGEDDEKDDSPAVVDFENLSTDLAVKYRIRVRPDLAADHAKLDKKLGLVKKLNTDNMNAFDFAGKITTYKSAESILDDFYGPRLEAYELRRLALIRKFEAELADFQNRVRFIRDVMDGKLVVFRRKIAELRGELEEKEFAKVDNSYEYLLSIRTSSYTAERVEELEKKMEAKEAQLKAMKETTPKVMWRADLTDFLGRVGEYEAWLAERAAPSDDAEVPKTKKRKTKA